MSNQQSVSGPDKESIQNSVDHAFVQLHVRVDKKNKKVSIVLIFAHDGSTFVIYNRTEAEVNLTWWIKEKKITPEQAKKLDTSIKDAFDTYEKMLTQEKPIEPFWEPIADFDLSDQYPILIERIPYNEWRIEEPDGRWSIQFRPV